jgi:hypothetical protein
MSLDGFMTAFLWRTADVVAPAPHRLYRARASAHFVLGANDQRILVQLS